MTRNVSKILRIPFFNSFAVTLMVFLFSMGGEARSGVINPELEFDVMHRACLSYLGGDNSAILALGNKGYAVRKRRNRIIASKKSTVNQAPNAFITIGKKIPARAKRTCQIEVSRIRYSLGQKIHSNGILKLISAGIIPDKSNGILFPKFRRGTEVFVVQYKFNKSAGIYSLTLSKLK